MTCPHSTHGDSATCSQCLGVDARVVSQQGPLVTVDGIETRAIAPDTDPHIQQPRRRRRGRK